MSETVVTVRDVFELPQPGSAEESSPRWQTLRQWMSEDVKGVKAAVVPDVTAKIAELLEVRIADIFLASWKKTDVIKEMMEESRKTPDALMNVELAEHTINSKHQPHIEIRTKKAPVKKIEFTLQLLFKLKEFRLRIQNGAIREIQTGACEGKGSLQYQGLAIAEKQLAPIKLPPTIALEGSNKTEDNKTAPDKTPAAVGGDKVKYKLTPPEPPKTSVPAKPQQTTPPSEAPKFMPPVKVTTQISETVREPKSAAPEEVPQPEEEEREQFVL